VIHEITTSAEFAEVCRKPLISKNKSCDGKLDLVSGLDAEAWAMRVRSGVLFRIGTLGK
jgi:hypothetical protein